MPKINLPETLHIPAKGKVFFSGEAFVSDEDAKLIKEELDRRTNGGDEAEDDSDKKPKSKNK